MQTVQTNASVNEFLEKVEDEQKKKDSKELVKIFSSITGEKAKMWGPAIIGFGKYHYKYASGREGDMPLVGFSPRKQNLTLYVVTGFDEYDKEGGAKSYLEKLGKHSVSKACLYIKRLEDVDIDVLKSLIAYSLSVSKERSAIT